jgi:hypothetical protein
LSTHGLGLSSAARFGLFAPEIAVSGPIPTLASKLFCVCRQGF